MKNLAALTAVLALAAGLAACSSGRSTATASTTPASGTETIYGKLTGAAAVSSHPVFHLTLTGPVDTTATIQLGAPPEKERRTRSVLLWAPWPSPSTARAPAPRA